MMTNREKEKIRDLRIKGLGYGAVAKQMGLKLETVKSYCRRHGLGRNVGALTETQDTNAEYIPCKNCGTEIKQIPKRKRKQFCCDACRYQWWNRHLNQVNRKAYYEMACQHCGKITVIYGDRRRKYCSHDCYIAEQYGKEPEKV